MHQLARSHPAVAFSGCGRLGNIPGQQLIRCTSARISAKLRENEVAMRIGGVGGIGGSAGRCATIRASRNVTTPV